MEVFTSPQYRPMKLKELAILLGVPKSERDKLAEVLDALVYEGKIGLSSKGKYGKPEISTVSGVFCGTQKGFGFVKVEGEEEDIFISERDKNGALNGDKVLISVLPGGRGRSDEGRVVKILEHANKTVIGTFDKSKGFGFVIPDDTHLGRDIFVQNENSMDAQDNVKVVCEIINFEGRNPEGKIVEILGKPGEMNTDVMSVIRAMNIPETFPEEVLRSTAAIPDAISEAEKSGREDFRDVLTFTIDGPDAKDLDDAVSLVNTGRGYELGVHIADVSHYVREHSPIDKEALNRGTSVYFTDRVIPMLPEKLSNGLCSLNAGEDKLSMSCVMDVDYEGNIRGGRVCESIIRSDKRMDYPSVAIILEDRKDDERYEAVCAEYERFIPTLKLMHELSLKFRKKRYERGAINFDFPEAKVLLDDKGRAIDIVPYERNEATRLIEDFMLAANETVAENAFWQEIPFIYRNHETPSEDKMVAFAAFLGGLGYTLHIKNNEVHPKELSKLMEKIEGTSEENLINRVLLRSMKQAKYSPENMGHFGLAAKYYTHFTSPIRRYPDLCIHRILKDSLHGKLDERRIKHYNEVLGEITNHSSITERRADEAEREILKLKKAEYIRKYIGEVFEGVISGVTSYGMYVELPNTVEGMIRISEIGDDHYSFDEEHMCIVGDLSRKTYSLGQKISVIVDDVSLAPARVDFRPYFDHEN